LGDSEESAVQHSVGDVVKPEVGQRRENDSEISATVRGKESGYVLDEDESSRPNKFIGDSHELVEQAAALSFEPGALAGDGEVLAGESSAEEIDVGGWGVNPELSPNMLAVCCSDVSDIGVENGLRPVGCKDLPPPCVLLGLEQDLEPGALEAEVEAADSAEQGADRHGLGGRGHGRVGGTVASGSDGPPPSGPKTPQPPRTTARSGRRRAPPSTSRRRPEASPF
jgi:hypothetical protein